MARTDTKTAQGFSLSPRGSSTEGTPTNAIALGASYPRDPAASRVGAGSSDPLAASGSTSIEARARRIPSYLTDTPLCRDCGRADHEISACKDRWCPFRKDEAA